MTEYQPPASAEPPTKKPSLWQRFKRWPLIARIATIGCGGLVVLFGGLIAIAIIALIVDPEGMQEISDQQEQERQEAAEQESRQAEEEAEREAEEGAAEAEEAEDAAAKDGEESESTEDESPEPEPEPSPTPTEEDEPEVEDEETAEEDAPEGIDDQIAGMKDMSAFEDAEVFFSEGDESYPVSSVITSVEVEPGVTEGSMCRSARDATIKGLEFLRDEVTEDYDEAQFHFTTESMPDATGDSSILGMATVFYDYETVQDIDSDSVDLFNVWESADGGGLGVVCERAES